MRRASRWPCSQRSAACTAQARGTLGAAGGEQAALEDRDVDGLRALVARLGVIRDLRALGEGAEAVRVDAGVMHEEVLAPLVGRDEAEALVVVEPLNDSGGHDVERTLHGVFCVLHAEGCRWQRLRALALLSPSPIARPDALTLPSRGAATRPAQQAVHDNRLPRTRSGPPGRPADRASRRRR